MANCYRLKQHGRLIGVFSTALQAETYAVFLSLRSTSLCPSDFEIEPAYINGIGF